MADPNQPAPSPQPDPKPTPAPDKPKPGDDPEKVSLTKAELQAQIQAALDADRRKAAEKAEREREAADRKAAEEQGKFKELATAEQAKREAAEAKLAAFERERGVTKALTKAAAEHDGYPLNVFEEYVLPKLLTTLPADADDAAVEKAAKDAAAKYVADNPRQPKAGSGAPPATNRVRGNVGNLPGNRPDARLSPTRRPFTHLSRNY